jgi:hypothetical protein
VTEAIVDVASSGVTSAAMLASPSTLICSFSPAVRAASRSSGISAAFLAVAVGLWVVWVQISSFIAGAYLAGRLRRRLPDATAHEVEIRDGSHGLLVWALGVVIGATLAASVASSAARTGASIVAAATGAIGSGAAQTVASSSNPVEYAVDTLFRPDNPQAVEDPAASGSQAARILAASMAQGTISADDKAYLARLIQARAGLAQPEAEQRIDRVMATLQSAAEAAKAAADKARRIGVIVAFVTAASLVLSAAAAWWAAGLGGRHRDEGTDFSRLVRWR